MIDVLEENYASLQIRPTISHAPLSIYPTCRPILDRLSRYEVPLWRQARQVLFTLQCLDRRKPWERRRLR